MKDPVFVTGVGVVTPCGLNLAATWAEVLEGGSGVRPVERFPIFGAATRVGGFVPGYETALPDGSLALEFGQMAIREALAMAGIVAGRDRVGLAVVATHGERRAPMTGQPTIIAGISELAEAIGAEAEAELTTSMYAACAAGGMAVCVGTENIRSGRSDIAIVGGVDVLLRDFDFFQFCNLYAMTTRDCPPEEASCPFDVRRDGFVLSEGAGFLVLESASSVEKRGAEPVAVIEGIGMSQNAYHMVASPPDAAGPIRAMAAALGDAHADPSTIDYLNAHGTSTRDNDMCEAKAINVVFNSAAEALAISSTKSEMGHLMAAAGAVEIVLCVQSVLEGAVPPTINLEQPDPESHLDFIPGMARDKDVRRAISNSFGFGGHNSSVVVGRVQ